MLAAAIAVEQLIRDRQPTDAAVVERVFAQGYAPNWEEMLRPGLAEVSVQAVAVLLAYARGEIAHVGWCFSARDDEELETQLPANSVESCPVCDSVYEIQKHARRVRVWRSTFLEGAGGVTHHEKFNAEKGEVPGQEPA